MVLHIRLYQYNILLFLTILRWIQCISLPKVSILLTLIFLLISSKFHGLNYGNFKILGRINIMLNLAFLFFPVSSMDWTMSISEFKEGLSCCYISFTAIGCKFWRDICPICWVICSRLLTETIIPLAWGQCGFLDESNSSFAGWFQKY